MHSPVTIKASTSMHPRKMEALAIKEMKPIWRRLRMSVKPMKINVGNSTNSFKSGTCFPRVKVHLVIFTHGMPVVVLMLGEAVVMLEEVVVVRFVISVVVGAAVVMVEFAAVLPLEGAAVSAVGIPVLPTGVVVVSALLTKRVVLTEEKSPEACTTFTLLDVKKLTKLSTVAEVVVGKPCSSSEGALFFKPSSRNLLLRNTPGRVSVMSPMSTCTALREFRCVTTTHCCAAPVIVGFVELLIVTEQL